MINEATFRDIPLPSTGNVNDYVAMIMRLRIEQLLLTQVRISIVSVQVHIFSFNMCDIIIYVDDGRIISQNVASLNILVHDAINLLYYEQTSENISTCYYYYNYHFVNCLLLLL